MYISKLQKQEDQSLNDHNMGRIFLCLVGQNHDNNEGEQKMYSMYSKYCQYRLFSVNCPHISAKLCLNAQASQCPGNLLQSPSILQLQQFGIL